MWVLKIKGQETRWKRSGGAFAAALPNHPYRDEDQASDENHGHREIREDAEVWIPGLAAQSCGQQKEPKDGGRRNNHNAQQTDPVIGQIDERRQPAATEPIGKYG